MRKFLITAFIMLLSLPVFAGTKLISGDLGVVYGVKQIPVVLNWDNAVYGKTGTLDDFLNKAYRSETWESQSLGYFIKEVNKKIAEYGTKVIPVKDGEKHDCEYIIIIDVYSISKGGDIKGKILLAKTSGEIMSMTEFSSDESDNDDEIAFRDQLENIGENYGKLMEKALKKAYKESRKK